jgi:redox-sensitive bicupin YhaK (pirin superfamily)
MNRELIQIIEGLETSDGAGVKLRRIIGGPDLNMLDPFLLFDEFGSDDPDDYIGGFPPHPHRGFETITYMLNGKFKHKDSAGNEGYLSDGSVQWMTAGKGVIHSEMPEQTNGLSRGFQLWLNLPKKLKMIEPSYNDIPAESIPKINIPGGYIKVICGEINGMKGPGRAHTGMLYYDISPSPANNIEISIDDDWNSFVYVYNGKAKIANRSLNSGQLGVLSDSGIVDLHADGSSDLKCIIVGGEKLNEPVARGGPFVMNTKAEILKAFSDYQEGILTK